MHQIRAINSEACELALSTVLAHHDSACILYPGSARFNARFTSYNPLDRKSIKRNDRHFTKWDWFSASDARFCALSKPFQNHRQNLKIPTRARDTIETYKNFQKNSTFFYIQASFSPLSRPNSFSVSQTRNFSEPWKKLKKSNHRRRYTADVYEFQKVSTRCLTYDVFNISGFGYVRCRTCQVSDMLCVGYLILSPKFKDENIF